MTHEILARRLADDHLMDLEPVAVSVVVAHVARGPGHVDCQGPGVLHGGIVPQLEPDVVAGHDLGHLCAAGVGHGARVAAEVVAGPEELLGGHDAVAVLAHVLPVVGELAVDLQLAEAVVGFGCLSRRQGPKGDASESELHG